MSNQHDGNNSNYDTWMAEQRMRFTPDHGFELVGIDYITDARGEIYTVSHFDAYRDALDAKRSRDNPEEYMILYKDADGSYCYR